MTEVSFAKTFLTTLDTKPTKYQHNHIFDPSAFGVRIPYALPKLSHPPHPLPPRPQDDLSKTAAPGAEPARTTTNAINVTLKSSRNPHMTLSLPATAPSTTIASIKQQIHNHLGGPSAVSSVDKIKILHNKKPIPASKQRIADLVDTHTKDLELGVMVMGGAPDPPPQTAPETATTTTKDVPMAEADSNAESRPVQPGDESGTALLHGTEFWTDLEGYLAQRLKSQEHATRLTGVFQRAWRSSVDAP